MVRLSPGCSPEIKSPLYRTHVSFLTRFIRFQHLNIVDTRLVLFYTQPLCKISGENGRPTHMKPRCLTATTWSHCHGATNLPRGYHTATGLPHCYRLTLFRRRTLGALFSITASTSVKKDPLSKWIKKPNNNSMWFFPPRKLSHEHDSSSVTLHYL